MKFDAVVGNPPYQMESETDSTGKEPLYHLFIDMAQSISDYVSMIHPARFLFNAGRTPKDWNKRMLTNNHFIVIKYFSNSRDVFPSVEIKGGVAITVFNRKKDYGEIGVFLQYSETASIIKKIGIKDISDSLSEIIYTQNRFDLSRLYSIHPEYKVLIGSNGKDRRFRNNIFDYIHLQTAQ